MTRTLSCAQTDKIASKPQSPCKGSRRQPEPPSANNKKDRAPSETQGLSLIPGVLFGFLCGALCGSHLLPLALGLSAEGLISYSLIFLLLGEGG